MSGTILKWGHERRIVAGLTFAVCSLISLLYALTPRRDTFDYPLGVLTTQRTLLGERPFADFDAVYGPLGYYLAAGVAALPETVLPPAIAVDVYYWLCALIYFAVAIHFCMRIPEDQPAMFLGVLGAITASSLVSGAMAFYSTPAFLLVLFAFVLAEPALGTSAKPGRIASQIGLGAAGAVAAFTRIHFGGYVFVALALVAVLAFAFRNTQVFRSALACLGFGALFLAVLLAIFWTAGIAAPFIRITAFFIKFTGNRSIPYRLAEHGIYEALVLTVGITMLPALVILRRRVVDGWLVRYALLAAYPLQMLRRADLEHAYPCLALLPLAVCGILPAPAGTGWLSFIPDLRFRRWLAFAPRVVLPLVVLIPLLSAGGRSVIRWPIRYWTGGFPASVTRHGVVVDGEEGRMLDRLDRLRGIGEEIFWASVPGDCQSPFDDCVNLSLYLADGRTPVMRRWYFDAVTSQFPEVQEGIVRELESRKIGWVGMQGVMGKRWRALAAPGEYKEATVVRDYVLAHYSESFRVQVPNRNAYYVIYRRRDL